MFLLNVFDMEVQNFRSMVLAELQHNGVFYFRAKVHPYSSSNKIVQIMDDEEHTVKINIKAIPEKGEANKAICQFLNKEFQCQCDIISGHRNGVKLIKLYLH